MKEIYYVRRMKALFIAIAGFSVHGADPEPFRPVRLELQLSPVAPTAEIEKVLPASSPADVKTAATYLQQGKDFFGQGKLDEAIHAFTKALALDRTNKEAHKWLMKAADQKGVTIAPPASTPAKTK